MQNEINEIEIRNEAVSLEALTRDIVIKNEADYINAGELLASVKEKMKKVSGFFKPLVAAAFQAHKEIKAKENEFMKPLEVAEENLRQELSRYATEKERIRREAEAKLIAEAEAKAEKERQRLAKLAEKSQSLLNQGYISMRRKMEKITGISLIVLSQSLLNQGYISMISNISCVSGQSHIESRNPF